jgi:hypothetical protein
VTTSSDRFKKKERENDSIEKIENFYPSKIYVENLAAQEREEISSEHLRHYEERNFNSLPSVLCVSSSTVISFSTE